MHIPVFTIKVPEYQVTTEPDHKAIGKKVDELLKKHFMGQTVGLRALSSQEHPGKTIDDLIAIIKRDGTDRYDPNRAGDRYDNLQNKSFDLFLLRRKVTPRARMFWQLSWSFYAFPLRTRGKPVRVDVLSVYDLSKLRAVRTTHTHEGYPITKRDGFVFKDPGNKPAALLGVIKVL